MNNSALKIEDLLESEVFDNTDLLKKKEAECVKILSALDEVIKSKGWEELNELVFKGVEERLERLLVQEAKKDELDTKVIYRLQGQLSWAKHYSSLEKLAKEYKFQLQNIKQQLNGK